MARYLVKHRDSFTFTLLCFEIASSFVATTG